MALELVCPRDRSALRDGVCEQGPEDPFVDGVPVFLVDEEAPTHAACGKVEQLPPPVREGIDPFVQEVIGATCGLLTAVVATELVHAMGPAVLIEPWNTCGGEFAFLEFIALCWGISCGRHRRLPAAEF